MKNIILITLLATTILATGCSKDEGNYSPIICEPIELDTYGFSTPSSFTLQTTQVRKYIMTFSNSHDYPIEFNVAFPNMPEGMQATIEQNNFPLTNTSDYYNKVTLTTNNVKTGKYKVPVVVSTNQGSDITTVLDITVTDGTAAVVNEKAEVALYNW